MPIKTTSSPLSGQRAIIVIGRVVPPPPPEQPVFGQTLFTSVGFLTPTIV